MSKMTGKEVADKWGRNLGNAQTDMLAGVDRMTVNPMEEAKKAIPKMKANLIKAFDSGKVARGFDSVSKEEWIDRYKKLVPERLQSGIDKSMVKAEQIFGKILAFQDGYKSQLDNMPTNTLEESINKMTFNVRKMAEFDKTK